MYGGTYDMYFYILSLHLRRFTFMYRVNKKDAAYITFLYADKS